MQQESKMAQTWLKLDEFCKAAELDERIVLEMIGKGKLASKEMNDGLYIEASKGTSAVVRLSPRNVQAISGEGGTELKAEFVEKTIGTILNLHERVVDAKDETAQALRDENAFLKDALVSMQELYDEDRRTVDALQTQIASLQEELEFTKRKYKLMWNKAVENYKRDGQ
jgi:polyhydroxyalkanoate synthesis regulator phasin